MTRKSSMNKPYSDIYKISISTTVLASTLLTLCSIVMPRSVYGQMESTSQNDQIEEVVVTGSHIVRDGYEAPTPVTVLGQDALESFATITLADAVNRLPAFTSSVSPNASTSSVSQGSAGLNQLNLRGLGAMRTLVLLDGMRLVGASFDTSFNNGGAVDINVIPPGLVKRVEVVTGGASAVYGSDAVGGVVNFVLDNEFVGFKMDVGGGISDYGDNETVQGKVTAGTTFAGGAGHITFHGSYSESGEVRKDDRPWTGSGFQAIPNPAYAVGNGEPQFIALEHVGLSTGAPGGVIAAGPLAGIAFGPGGAPYQLQGIVHGRNLIGGSWEDTRTDQTANLAPNQEVGSLFTRVGYYINDSVEVYGQLQWANAATVQTRGALPSFFLGNLTVEQDNPFIPDSIRTAMTAAGVTSLPYGLTNVGGGVGVDFKREFQRFAGGFNGEFEMFATDWTWDANYQYSKSAITNAVPNNPIKANLRQAIDSVAGPNGVPVCRDQSNGCVPYNPFGIGVNSQAVFDYVTGTASQSYDLIQNSASVGFAGTPFSNWAGPVSLAFGADWRSESVDGTSTDLDLATAFSFGNYKPSTGEYEVAEGFLETIVPLAIDTSWAQALELNAAVRATHYSTSGSVTTWKVGATYQPIDDIRFRFTRSRDIRAPNLAELFTVGTFGNSTYVDPFNDVQVIAVGTSSGNPNLDPEIADSMGVGVVYSPRWLAGFEASLDYYDIEIDDAIQSVGGQQYINLCFEGETQYCQFFTRDAAGNIDTVLSTRANIAYIKQSGLDIEASYAFPLADGDLTTRLLGTYVFDYTASALGVVTEYDGTIARRHGAPGAPTFRARGSLTYDEGAFSSTLAVRYISPGVVSNEYVECVSECPLSTAFNPTFSHNSVSSHTLFDAAFDYELMDGMMDLYLAIDNIFNVDPPYIPGAIENGYVFGQRNNGYGRLGRMYRVGIRLSM